MLNANITDMLIVSYVCSCIQAIWCELCTSESEQCTYKHEMFVGEYSAVAPGILID